MALTSLSTERIVDFISMAQRRLTYMAPGLDSTISKALSDAFWRLGSANVNVIVDIRPDVFRLGYGTLEALEALQLAAEQCGSLVCHQDGIQVGVLLSDDVLAVFAPKPMLVSEHAIDSGEVNGLILGLGETPSSIADQIGASDSMLDREFGLEGVPNSSMTELKADLERNPPQKFDLTRTVRVFNALFEFVELEIKGAHVSRREVTLPKLLMTVPSAEVQKKMKQVYPLIDGSDAITEAEQEVEELRKEIEKRFLRVIPGFGMAVMRADRDLMDIAMIDLYQAVALFQSIVESELEETIKRSINEIAGALSPAIAANPPEEYHRWAKWRDDASAQQFVKDNLRDCFANAAKSVQHMTVRVVIKGVTYESLKDQRFIGAAKKAFPELEELFNEFEAAKASEDSAQHGNQ